MAIYRYSRGSLHKGKGIFLSYQLVSRTASRWEKFKRINGFWINRSNSQIWFTFRKNVR